MGTIKLCVGAAAAVAMTAVFAVPAHASSTDRDGDGIPNRWERSHGLDPRKAADALRDFDHDGLVNRGEYRLDGLLRDEDSDNDGLDDGDERRLDEEVDDRDSDNDGRIDGHEDADHDGVANEDEDDARETCLFDDDDRDHDDVDDEDENELRLSIGDSDSDNDGITDGHEDRDGDGEANEDEDDSDTDSCSGDRDGDGEDDEDESDRFGTIASFDTTTNTLVVDSLAGVQVTGLVTEDTEIEFEDADDQEGADQEATTANLQAGVVVAELEFDDDTGTLEEIEIYLN